MLKNVTPEWDEISMDRAIAAASPVVSGALEKVLAGNDLSFDEGLTLATVDGSDLVALVKVAAELRRLTNRDRVTYVVNRNLNFTNVCIIGSAFCGFSRDANSPDAYFQSTDMLIAKSLEAVERGATEVCIQGGLPKDLDGYYYVELLRAIKARLPELHVHAFSPMEIRYGVEKTRLPLRDYLQMLKESGLGSIPGTAAEILDDSVRRNLSPSIGCAICSCCAKFKRRLGDSLNLFRWDLFIRRPDSSRTEARARAARRTRI
jgi:FO synthase subunit 2